MTNFSVDDLGHHGLGLPVAVQAVLGELCRHFCVLGKGCGRVDMGLCADVIVYLGKLFLPVFGCRLVESLFNLRLVMRLPTLWIMSCQMPRGQRIVQ